MLASSAAYAETQHAVRFICPFPVGGVVDSVTRVMADAVRGALGRPVIVDAQSGANGALATRQLLAAPPDGQTWMMATLGSTLALTTTGVPADLLGSMRAVAVVAHDVSVLVVPAASRFGSLADLLAVARLNPGTLTYLRTGNASLSHLVVGCLGQAMRAQLEAVDYRGVPPGTADLVAGRLDLAVLPLGQALPHTREGRLRPLALVGARRSEALPNLPTLTELGFGDANVGSWAMVVVREGTPAPALQTISRAFNAALANADVRARLTALRVIPADASRAEDADGLLKHSHLLNARLLAAIGSPIRADVPSTLLPPACAPPPELRKEKSR